MLPSRSAVWAMYVSHMFNEIYLFIHLALIPVFITEFELTLFQVSFVATVPTLIGIIMNIMIGFLVDRIGARPLLILGFICQALGGIIVAESWSFETLIFGLSFIGIANPLYHNSGLSTISRILSGQKLTRGAGIHAAAGSIGSSIGLFTLSLLLAFNRWRLTYLIWAVPTLAWALFLTRTRVLDQDKPGRKQTRDDGEGGSVVSRPFAFFLILVGLTQAGSSVITTFMTTYMVLGRGISEATASLIFTAGPLISIVGSLFSGYVGSWMGDVRILFVTIGITGLSAILIPVMPTTSLLTIMFVCFAFFSCTVWPPINSLTARLTPTEKRGLAYSLSQTTYQATSALAPPVAARLIETTSMSMMFPFSFMLMLAGVVFLKRLPMK